MAQNQDGLESLETLRALAGDAPNLVALVSPLYDQALQDVNESAARRQGMNAFHAAVARIEKAVPSQWKTPADAARAERAAIAFARFRDTEWEGIESVEKKNVVEAIEASLVTPAARENEARMQTAATDALRGFDPRVDAALATGAWGELKTFVEEWEGKVDGLIEGAEKGDL